ncbi:hypothetical protein PAEAM_28400 [Paenibacillus sp. GM1FR]|uniref:hypothetical protein n=1 Tax=Paenibacillus sp. GM1FR TaxID=2059267 RepID=UPI000C27F845|nr:hypothetical protein [Paenibacillus sp. GM1FR]PJN59805.1 hypothetical protein PAEAM_28400 [Paenibacillus sp. GM1FR]
MSTFGASDRVTFMRCFALTDWYEEDSNKPKQKDIEEAEEAMNFIGHILGKSYQLHEELDIARHGGDTPKKPEARFKFDNSKKKKKAVMEIKQFPFESNKDEASLLFTRPKLFKWFLDFHHTHADEDHRIIFHLKLKQISFDPTKALRDLELANPFEGIFTEYLELKAVKWHRSEEYHLTADRVLYFDDLKDQFIILEESNKPVDINAAIKDSFDYEKYADLLYDTWIEKKWDKKFNQYKKDSKFLYLKIMMSPMSEVSFYHEAFLLKKFIKVLLSKYGNSISISQLEGILFYAAGTYQFLEFTKKGPILHT